MVPLAVSAVPAEFAPPPTYTPILAAKWPPVARPTPCACRSISVTRLWYSLFSTLRSPVKVPDEDWVARVFNRSSILPMLFMPPSMIWSCATPSLALRTPCMSSEVSLRNLLAIARPAASSPDELMRNPDVRR